MKRLDRYILLDVPGQGPNMAPNAAGMWVRYDDALEAIQARQDVVDVRTGDRDRYRTAVEAADRMRALLGRWALKFPNDAEIATAAAVYDGARSLTLGPSKFKPRPPKEGAT